MFSRLFAASEPLGLVPLRLGGARTGFALPFGPYLQRYEIHERRAGGEELYAELGRVEFLPEAPGQDPPPWPWLGFADTDGDGQNELLVTWDNCGALALATETACERR